MSTPGGPEPSFEDLLSSLEKTIERLSAGTAPLDELVSDHERAQRLLTEAERRLADLRSKAEVLSSQLSAH